MKKTICIDFDGVIHSYTSGWCGADVITDLPVPGAIDFLKEATKHFTVAIFSSRNHQPGGKDAMKNFITYWATNKPNNNVSWVDVSWVDLLTFPTEKPAALVTIDDRAIPFKGTFPTIEEIKGFKPWNKK